MACEKKPVILKWNYNSASRNHTDESFDTVLDTTCQRLWERQIQYSLRRIREMENELNSLDKELEQFIRMDQI